MSKHWKLIAPLAFLLAALLGLLQHEPLSKFSLGANHFSLSKQPADENSLSDYYQKSQALIQSQNQTSQVSFLAVGDIMLSRGVATAMQKAKDPEFPFKETENYFSSVDFSFGNLESPLGDVVGGHSLIFGAPQGNTSGLINNNFRVLNLANNHALDQGLSGLQFTKTYLNTLGIQTEGAGNNLDEAWTPAVVKVNDVKICFVGASYASANDGGKTRNNYVARMEDLDKLKTAIATAKAQCDFTVATMHGGVEYTRTPNDLQIKFAHAAIDDGADVVIGAHPHWIQTIEKYCPMQQSPPFQGGVPPPGGEVVGADNKNCPNPKYIFYSLGNFIFDQSFSEDTKQGLALKIQISKNQIPNLQGPKVSATLNSIELMPVIIENSQPRPATADETKSILDKIEQKETTLK